MPRELPGLYKLPGAASQCSNHVDELLKRFLRLAGVGGEEEEVVVEEEAEGGERKLTPRGGVGVPLPSSRNERPLRGHGITQRLLTPLLALLPQSGVAPRAPR